MGLRLFDLSESAEAAAPAGPLLRVMFLVAYDGSTYRGFAPQKATSGVRTVAGSLIEALSRMSGAPVSVVCAGRTDAGVHALGQVVHADMPAPFVLSADFDRVARSLSRQLGPSIAVLAARVAPTGFDARHSAVWRAYRYTLLTGPAADPLLAPVTWHLAAPLDLLAMRGAADVLLGEHDFSSFCRRPPSGGSLTRRVTSVGFARGVDDGRLLYFSITANAFCQQMVRSLVGALVSVGEGRMTAADMFAALLSADRSQGSRLAPPGGLCLMSVGYPEEFVPGGVWRV